MNPTFDSITSSNFDKYCQEELLIPEIVLMENAGIGIVDAILSEKSFQTNSPRFLIICGNGNNGGDGFCIARHLINRGHLVDVISLFSKEQMSKAARTNYEILCKLDRASKSITLIKGFTAAAKKAMTKSDVVIDSILGIGIKSELRAPLIAVVKALNEHKAYKVAVDIPTGLNVDTGYGEAIFNADLTITLGLLKRGLFIGKGASSCGKVVLKPIGAVISPEKMKARSNTFLIEKGDVVKSLPSKKRGIHKYTTGKIFLLAGSSTYPGAALLAATASMKAGAGATKLFCPNVMRAMIHTKTPEFLVVGYGNEKNYLTSEDLVQFNKIAAWADVLAIGPGLGREPDTTLAVRKILSKRRNEVVILDADALFAISNRYYEKLFLKNYILTPHLGEFALLLGIPTEEVAKDLLLYGRKFVKESKSYLVLKGDPTMIFVPNGNVYINTVGNPGMAKAGTGDVLVGVIAALIAQGKDIMKGVLTGVYLHSLSADLIAKKETPYGVTPSDIIKYLPHAFSALK